MIQLALSVNMSRSGAMSFLIPGPQASSCVENYEACATSLLKMLGISIKRAMLLARNSATRGLANQRHAIGIAASVAHCINAMGDWAALNREPVRNAVLAARPGNPWMSRTIREC